jgi:polar amino acid transport system substrate-binding protein
MRVTVTAAIFIMVTFVLRPASADQFHLVSSEYPPYAYAKDGQVVGIAVEIVRETFRRLGHDVSIKLYPWPHALNNTKTGKADAIFTAYDTPERRQFLDYSHVILIEQTVSLFALKGKGITYGGDFSRLTDKVIGARLGVSYGEIYDSAVRSGQRPSRPASPPGSTCAVRRSRFARPRTTAYWRG